MQIMKILIEWFSCERSIYSLFPKYLGVVFAYFFGNSTTLIQVFSSSLESMIWNKNLIRHLTGIVLLLTLVACSPAVPPETKAAISTLKGINSKLDVGLNFAGYADALQNAKVAVDQSIEADPKSKNNQVLKKVMSGHLAALQLWRCNLENNWTYQNQCRKTTYETLIYPLYPELEVELKKQDSNLIDHDKILNIMWKYAEKDLNTLKNNY
jgi:hypothetical protein